MFLFFSPRESFYFISQSTKALDGWTPLATVGNILEEDTIPNEVLSSQRAFYWWGETFVGLLLFGRFFMFLFLLVWLLLLLLPSLLKSVSLQDEWCLVKEHFLWIVLGCHYCLSSQVGRGEFSFAHISLDSPLALFTGYVAAPVIFAVATLHHFVHVGVVASATAHQVAAVTPIGSLVALSGRRKMLWASANSCRDSQTTAMWCCLARQLCKALGEASTVSTEPTVPYTCKGGRGSLGLQSHNLLWDPK